MTIRPMKRAGAAALVSLSFAALALPACGPGRDPGLEKAAADQARLLDEAVAEIDDLTQRADQLEGQLAEMEMERTDTSAALDRVSERLWESLKKLRKNVSEAKSSSAAASSEAAAALADAGAAARALAILENRFEYHLRQHGGG